MLLRLNLTSLLAQFRFSIRAAQFMEKSDNTTMRTQATYIYEKKKGNITVINKYKRNYTCLEPQARQKRICMDKRIKPTSGKHKHGSSNVGRRNGRRRWGIGRGRSTRLLRVVRRKRFFCLFVAWEVEIEVQI